MKTLRLCFVGPAESITLRRWTEWFVDRGHETVVLTVEPAPADQMTKLRQIDLRTVRWPRKLGRLLSAVKLARLVRQFKPDVLHLHYIRGLAWGALLTSYHPCVVTPWGSDVLEEQGAFRDWLGQLLTPRVLKQADLVTVHSAYMQSRVRKLLPSDRSVVRIGWGVNLHKFRPNLDVSSLRERWGICRGQCVIFSPRLAQPFYRHDRIIRAMPMVCKKVPEALLVITEQFADQRYVQSLRHLASQLGIASRVRFVGSIPYAEMPLWMNLSDAVVMTPYSDGMPNTLIEAMACGAVPILSRLPQYAEIVRHGVNGFFVDPDQDDLAGVLIHVLTDAVLRRDIGRINREQIVKIADQDHEMALMEDWYLRLAHR